MDDEELKDGSPAEPMQDVCDAKSAKPVKGVKRRGGCMMLILAMLALLVALIAGAVCYAWFSKQIGNRNFQSYTAAQSYFLNREKICETAFVQDALMVDTHSSFPWNFDFPMNVGHVELGRADVKVKSTYLVKYGIDEKSIKLWEYYPATSELQISMPSFKVLSLQTLSQEVDSENETFLKKLQTSERNEALRYNRDEAQSQASVRIEKDEKLHKECLEQLKSLLSSFGIKLVIVEPIPSPR